MTVRGHLDAEVVRLGKDVLPAVLRSGLGDLEGCAPVRASVVHALTVQVEHLALPSGRFHGMRYRQLNHLWMGRLC